MVSIHVFIFVYIYRNNSDISPAPDVVSVYASHFRD